MSARLVGCAFFAVAFVVVSCGSGDGGPSSYDDQIDPETGLSAVEAQWRDRCMPGLQGEIGESQANEICVCSYSGFTSEIPFSDFADAYEQLELDATLFVEGSSEPSSTEARIVDIVLGCIAGISP